MNDPHNPRTWSWPFGMPESLAATDHLLAELTCSNAQSRRCEYRVRIHRKAHDFTLKEHLEKSCPMRSDPDYKIPAGAKPFAELA